MTFQSWRAASLLMSRPVSIQHGVLSIASSLKCLLQSPSLLILRNPEPILHFQSASVLLFTQLFCCVLLSALSIPFSRPLLYHFTLLPSSPTLYLTHLCNSGWLTTQCIICPGKPSPATLIISRWDTSRRDNETCRQTQTSRQESYWAWAWRWREAAGTGVMDANIPRREGKRCSRASNQRPASLRVCPQGVSSHVSAVNRQPCVAGRYAGTLWHPPASQPAAANLIFCRRKLTLCTLIFILRHYLHMFLHLAADDSLQLDSCVWYEHEPLCYHMCWVGVGEVCSSPDTISVTCNGAVSTSLLFPSNVFLPTARQ